MATTKTKTIAGTTGGITLAGILIWLASLGGGGSPPPPTPTTRPSVASTTTSSTTTTVKPPAVSAVKRFGADDASWNQPAAKYGPAPDLQEYALRFFDYAGGGDKPGTVSVAFGDYSIPVHDAAKATTIARVYQTTWSQALYTSNVGATMPWNPSWRPGTGNDNLMTIIDYKTGTVWSVGGIGQLPVNCFDFFGPNGQAGYELGNPLHLCSTGVLRHEGAYTFKDGSTVDGRGMGINQIALTVRAEEVRAGVIAHAVPVAITGTMFGAPACAPPGDPTVPGFGRTCGGFVKPATKLERTNPNVGCAAQAVTEAERAKTVPEGMRFVLKISDSEIEQWLDSRKFTGPLRRTAKIFAVALRDYGWIAAESGCFGSLIQTDSAIEGDAASIWRNELGITGTGNFPNGNLIDGLIKRDRIVVIQPPP